MKGGGLGMERGRSQVMYKFLPGSVYSLEGGKGIARTIHAGIKDLKKGSLDMAYVMALVNRRVQSWSARSTSGWNALKLFPGPVAGNFRMGEPDDVVFQLFPLTFRCTKCSRVTTYASEQEASRRVGPNCDRCKDGALTQLHYLQIHHCGNVAPLQPPACPKCRHSGDVTLDDKGKRRFEDVDWRCTKCSTRIGGPLSRRCDNPDCESNDDNRALMRTLVHTASPVFYPHMLSFVNLQSAARADLLGDRNVASAVAASTLRLLPKDVNVSQAIAWAKAGGNVALTPEQENQVEAMIPDLQAQMRELLIEQNRRSIVGNEAGLRKSIEAVEKLDLFGEGEIDADLVQELLEFSLGRDQNRMNESTLPEFAKQSAVNGWPELEKAQLDSDRRLQALGFENSTFLQAFPLSTVVYGFTRNSREPDAALLRAFPRIQSIGKHPLYVSVVNTEGILFTLSPRRVIEWLAANSRKGLPNAGGDGLDARTWFLRSLDIPGPFEVPEDENYTQPTLGLLHTLSHVMLRSAAMHSGLDRSSLREYLFPHLLSFVIYHNTTLDHSLGGLFTLYEQSMQGWIDSTLTTQADCIYDPVCKESHAASCHACTHIGEYSCERFNSVLDRRFVFGGDSETGRIKGFWENNTA